MKKEAFDTDDPVVHLICGCDENTALCGHDSSNEPVTDDKLTCRVCIYLDDKFCPHCGHLPRTIDVTTED